MKFPRTFKFSPGLTIGSIVLALIMLRASAWQWERYKFKVALLKTYEQNSESPAIDFSGPATTKGDFSDYLNRKIHLSGTYDYEHQVIVLNRSSESGPGYWLLTPLKIDGTEKHIIVSRGFIPFSDRAPETWTKYSKVASESFDAVVQSSISKRFWLGPAASLESNEKFVTRWLYPNIEQIAKQLPYPVITSIFVQRLRKQGDMEFPAESISLDVPPSTHFGYTIEWILLAGATLLISFLMQAFPRSRKVFSANATPLIFLTLGLVATTTSAFAIEDPKAMAKDVGIIEHLGQNVDLQLTFHDEAGAAVKLADIQVKDHPLIIVPVYFSCPRLCGLVLTGVAEMISKVALPIGKEYTVVAVSFNTAEDAALARKQSDKYLAGLGAFPYATKGLRFLTGDKEDVDKLMKQIGFQYQPDGSEFAHAAVLAVLSPVGMISRYFYGVKFEAKDMRMALVEASQGKIGNTLDKVLYFCFRYDHLSGKYSLLVMNIVRAVSLIGAGALATLLIVLRLRERSRASNEDKH